MRTENFNEVKIKIMLLLVMTPSWFLDGYKQIGGGSSSAFREDDTAVSLILSQRRKPQHNRISNDISKCIHRVNISGIIRENI
jgi:hypothetical protein